MTIGHSSIMLYIFKTLYGFMKSITKIWKEKITLNLKGVCVLLQLKECSGRTEGNFWRMRVCLKNVVNSKEMLNIFQDLKSLFFDRSVMVN